MRRWWMFPRVRVAGALAWAGTLGIGLAAGAVGCGPTIELPPASETASSTADGPGSSTASEPTSTGVASVGSGTAVDGSTSGTSAVDSGTAESGASDSTGARQCFPPCYRGVSECTDGIDNDGDGVIDSDDPECITPCDNDESATIQGLWLGNGDCQYDCFFDDNTGHGDDGCATDLACDPLGPAEWYYCEANPESLRCQAKYPPTPRCVALCVPMTPPGCDCYGCCSFPTPAGPEDRWLNHPDCSFADISLCPPCTKDLDCGNACDDPCEWCFGEPEPPAGCPEVTCEYGSPCTEHCDCPEGQACQWGCCREVSILM